MVQRRQRVLPVCAARLATNTSVCAARRDCRRKYNSPGFMWGACKQIGDIQNDIGCIYQQYFTDEFLLIDSTQFRKYCILIIIDFFSAS